MASLNPYLTFNGNCEEAFQFYRSVFGGDYEALMRFSDVPSEYAMPEAEQDKIMHMALPIGNGNMLMGSDSPSHMPQVSVGDNLSISISAQSEEEATRLFNGLSAGGQVTMPLEVAFWGDLFGMFVDRYGVSWMVSYMMNQA